MSGCHVLLACSGLDHARRGFETFARECFEALQGRPEITIELVKGSGASGRGERSVPTLTREARAIRAIARARSVQPFIVEHIAFALALIPLIVRRRPDVVYFSEWHVGRVLAAWRRAARQQVALAFCNGALIPGGYGHLDRVQQLVPGAIEYTAARGEPSERQMMLPLGVAIPRELAPLGEADRDALRRRLDLPADRTVVLSAGALNHQKRMAYLVDEVHSLPEPRPYLLLLGQEEADTPEIRRRAHERLGADGHAVRTVAPGAMGDHYRASDAFVLASLWESFGRVLVEAQSHGLPCLAHDYPVMSWILGEEGDTADLRAPGPVAAWLSGLGPCDPDPERRARRHRYAHQRFSWDALAGRYAEFLRGAAVRS